MGDKPRQEYSPSEELARRVLSFWSYNKDVRELQNPAPSIDEVRKSIKNGLEESAESDLLIFSLYAHNISNNCPRPIKFKWTDKNQKRFSDNPARSLWRATGISAYKIIEILDHCYEELVRVLERSQTIILSQGELKLIDGEIYFQPDTQIIDQMEREAKQIPGGLASLLD